MPGPSATLFNHETNTYEAVPAEQVGAAIASGKFTSTGTTTTQSAGGLVTRPAEQMGAAEAQGETEAGGAIAAQAAGARRNEQKELLSNKVLSLAEGFGDALSLGLIHGTSEEADLRREADSGSALVGQLLGTGAGLFLPGPVSSVVGGGEKLGAALAKVLLGEAKNGFAGAAARGIAEASANAALMAASSFGHQVTDAVIANKPFAAESIVSEAKLGALLGFGAGFAGSAFGQLARASRGAVEASGVAVQESRTALAAIDDLSRTWDSVVDQHAQRVGVLKALADDGHIPGDMHLPRSGALGEAEKAREALRALNSERSLGGDAKEFQKWRDAVERYQDAVVKLDDLMTPSPLEHAHANRVTPGAGDNAAGPQIHPLDVDQMMADKGFRSPMGDELNAAMTPEARAKYEEIYGRPFVDDSRPTGQSGTLHTDEANLGGSKTPTSELGTNPGVKRRPAASAPDTIVDPKVERFNRQPTKFREPNDTVIEAESQTVLPRQVMKAGEAPATAAETAQEFVGSVKQLQEGTAERAATGEAEKSRAGEGKKAVKDYLNSWFKEFDAKSRVSLGDQLNARLTEALESIARAHGGRLDSAGGLELLKSLGLREATSPLGQRLDQVWSLGQAGKFAADEARGVKTPLRKGLVGALQRYAIHKGARGIAGAVAGGAIGGPIGAVLGMALTSAGFAGAAASTAGKLMQQIGVVGEALLKGRRATLAVKVVTGNRPYQYSEAGPISDPVDRIVEVQRLAANPDAVRARVTKQMGDLALTSPELAQHLADTAVNHVQALSMAAPAIMFTPTGGKIRPSGTALNRFFDFENALHDLPGTLQSVGSGTASQAQLKAFHIGFPAVHSELVRGVIGELDDSGLNEAKLRTMERALGVPLTRASADPTITSRFQGNWESPAPAPQPAQAFKITAPKPTAVQSASGGRAPGNERIAR